MIRTRESSTIELDARLERWLIGQIQAAQADLNQAPAHAREAARHRYDCAVECWADFVAVRSPRPGAGTSMQF